MSVSHVADWHVSAGRGAKAAFVTAHERLTYDELRRQTNRFGQLAHALGIRREERLLLVLDDSTVFPIAFLGAMRVGAVPVPVSPMDTPANFRYYVEDSYARVVVADRATLPQLQAALDGLDVTFLVRGAAGPQIVELDAALESQPSELEPVTVHRDDPAFWLYSSGSTGTPKGVVHLQHDIGVTCERYGRQLLGLNEHDICFSTTKLFHAYGLGNGLSFPLWLGATSVLMDGPSKPDRIVEHLQQHRPTVFFSVPALYRALCEAPTVEDACRTVRLCVSAAEVLPPTTARLWHKRLGLDIIDGIGSTEMLHIYCSNRPGEITLGTTGRPVPGYDLRLVDEQGNILDGPAQGELEIKGDSCAAFYWHQHEKTKSRMRGAWFASGDRYERRVDGTFAYIGRVDDMFKVGGLWVSPVDLETTLCAHPRVAGAGVIGISIDGMSRIAAYIQCRDQPGDDAFADELRAWCKARLRRYEYPHLIAFVSELPRTPTGKIQRFRLRELAIQDRHT